MICSYYKTSNTDCTEAKNLTAITIEKISPDAVFLLGTLKYCHTTATIFSSPVASSSNKHFFLLVLVEKDEEHSLNSIQDKIENNVQHLTPTTAITMNTAAFCRWIHEGQPFAVNVTRHAEKLYRSETCLIPITASINEQEQKLPIQALFIQSGKKLDSFLAGAELFKIRQEYRLAAFMLHQAAEQALSAMLTLNTGLKINTHSIDKLIRYCSMFCPALLDLFQKNSEREKKLYALLNKAYIDTRYRDDYTINFDELSALMDKLNTVKAIFMSCKPR